MGIFTKSFDIGRKGAVVRVKEISADMLAKINKFPVDPLNADAVYVRKFLLAHNGVDRDRERFPEDLLDDFAATLPGKNFLFAHDRRKFLPLGLWFDASAEEMTKEKFKELTGEDPRLPDDISMVKVLWAWTYMLKTASNEDVITNIHGGVYRHVSIGFSAADLYPVKGPYEETLFWEYKGPGEATEGSLVWLGAQQGATGQKAAKEKHRSNTPPPTGGKTTMKKIKLLLGTLLGKTFGDDTSDDALAEEVKQALETRETEIQTLKTAATTNEPLLAELKTYREGLAADYARMKTALGECEAGEEDQKTIKSYADGLPLVFLKTEVKHLQTRMDEKFPAGHQLEGDQSRDKSSGGADENPLVPKEEKG